MSFAEIAASKSVAVGCTIGSIIAGLPDDEAAELTAMLDADLKTWPHTGGTEPRDSIQLALRAEGYEVGEKPIGRHRTGACRCTEDDR